MDEDDVCNLEVVYPYYFYLIIYSKCYFVFFFFFLDDFFGDVLTSNKSKNLLALSYLNFYSKSLRLFEIIYNSYLLFNRNYLTSIRKLDANYWQFY